MSKPSKSKPKYKIETVYLGTVDNHQAEEEIITILKHQFLTKMSTDTATSGHYALTKEKEGNDE